VPHSAHHPEETKPVEKEEIAQKTPRNCTPKKKTKGKRRREEGVRPAFWGGKTNGRELDEQKAEWRKRVISAYTRKYESTYDLT